VASRTGASSSCGNKTTVYHTVHISFTDLQGRERSVNVATMIPSKRAAIWLVDKIKSSLRDVI
jgi:hypothetical protein